MGTATAGRYDNVAKAIMPGELPSEGEVNKHCLIVHGAVPDPSPAFRGKRQRAAINVRTDALEREYQLGRVGEAGYQAARTYQRVLQKSRIPGGGGGGWNPTDRVDQASAHEAAIANRIDRARAATEMLAETRPVLGIIGQRVLELVLVEELSLSETARRIRGSNDRQHVIYYANLFRDMCEALATFWCRRDQRAPRV